MSNPDPFGLVGQVLDGQFRVDKMVGEGGFSIVYRGHHQGLNEPIAIKCLKLPAALGTALVDTFVQRFRDESRILYRLSQGNLHVVRSIAAGTTQAPATGALVPYMVLEWLEGRSLQTDFEQRKGQKGRPLAEVIRMFDSAADGLAHAHAQGVIHRDLNPGNLFLTKTNAGEKMKVLDFGVAKIMHDSTLDIGPRAQTIGAIRIFAPAYGAPEQFDDRIGQVGAWSDVYAFALVILQALQDKCVMEGEHLGDFAQGAVDPQKRPTPRALGIDVPEEVERVFARATALYTKNRWQSAGDFWRSLVTAANNASGVAVVNPLGSTTPAISAASSAVAAPPKDPPVPVAKGPLAKTMPLGSTTPGVPPGFRPGAPRPRTPTTIGIPAPASPNANAPASQAAPNTPPVPGAPRPPMGSTPGVPRPPMGSSPGVPRPPMPSSPGAGVSPPAAPARTTARPPSTANMAAAQAAPPPSSRSGSTSAPITKPPTTAPAPGAPMRPQMDSEPPTGIAPPPLSARGGSVNMRTATGLAPSPWDAGEPEDESTKVGAPTDEVLRAIADAESKPPAPARHQSTAAMAPLVPPHAPTPSPVLENSDELATLAHAALGGRPGAPAQAPPAEESKRESSIPPPPDSGGTLMMVAPGAEAQHAQRLEYQARIAEEDAEKAAAPPKPTKQQQTVAFAQRPAFPQPPPPLQVQPSAAPRPEVSQPYDQATQAAPVPPVKRAGLSSTLAMASPLQYPPPPHGAPPDPHTSQQVPPQDAFGADGPFGAPITPPVSPGATSQIHGLSAPPNHQVAMPANPMPQGDGSSITAWAPLVPPTPAQGGAVAGPMGSPQQQQGGAPFPAHFNNPGARPSMVDGGALPQSFAEAHVPTAGEKKFPVIPVAAGAGLLAVIGIVLVVVALKATKAPNPDGTTSASADTSSAGPVPVPVPVTTETASAAVTTPPAATVIEADDASAAPATTEDASVADAAAAAASASASAATTAAPPPTVATATPGTAAPPPTVATATPPPNPFAPPPPASAKPAADPNAFSEGAARGKLAQANGVLAFCKKEGGVTGPGNASVTFAIDGSVAGVALDPPYAGTSEGNCVAGQFRRAKVAPFTGAPQTIRHSFEVPK